jgi:hypothetical protein
MLTVARLKLKEIDTMVAGAQSGDYFFFACWCLLFFYMAFDD